MWIFRSPQVVYGPDALSHLALIEGKRAFIVTDEVMVKMGFVALVKEQLANANIESTVFAEVEPEPSLQTVQRGANVMLEYQPDWIIGLGGGSAMDAAKAMWVLYEHPDLAPEAINPVDIIKLRQKARMIGIPTTSGTGAEATWAAVITDTADERKLALPTPEMTPDIAIVDPALAAKMPPRLTGDTGLDALTHAVEGYTSSWHNDFCDGLCLEAIGLVSQYLPRAYADGSDMEAREHMHNAATIAGLGFINSMAALAHALGHAWGGVFHAPHGRLVGLFLPYTIEFAVRGGGTRYAEITRFLGMPGKDEEEGARSLVHTIRVLQKQIESPTLLAKLGIARDEFTQKLDKLVSNAEGDTQMVAASRVPSSEETRKLFEYAYDGKTIDF
jgi:alcohol dehydrogenase class IV